MKVHRPRLAGMTRMAAVAAVAATIAGGATAIAGQDGPAASREPANLGQVKLDVGKYYGGYEDADGHHHPSQTSRWAKDTRAALAGAQAYLARQLAQGVRHPAIVLDVDDTSETTYGFEADNDFGYDSAKAEQAINNGEFEAIRPTVALANFAADHGVRVFVLTGRPEHQRSATLKNLEGHGFPAFAGTFLKPEGTAPGYLPCGLKCTTVQYKSGTRAHIESLGNAIVLNVGDQYSDLEGGHAKRAVKVPNPMYYLP
jgi:predicted secreted acid phosphatase